MYTSVFHYSFLTDVKKVTNRGRKMIRTNTWAGIGQKCETWIIPLESDLVLEFDRMQMTGINISPNILLPTAKNVILNFTNEYDN